VKIKFDFFKLIISLKIKIMDQQEQIKRSKKSDKSKNNFAKTGGLTKKHIRQLEYKKEQSKLKK